MSPVGSLERATSASLFFYLEEFDEDEQRQQTWNIATYGAIC